VGNDDSADHCPRLLEDITVIDLYIITSFLKIGLQLLGDDDGPVLSAGAADGDGQVALALGDKVGRR